MKIEITKINLSQTKMKKSLTRQDFNVLRLMGKKIGNVIELKLSELGDFLNQIIICDKCEHFHYLWIKKELYVACLRKTEKCVILEEAKDV